LLPTSVCFEKWRSERRGSYRRGYVDTDTHTLGPSVVSPPTTRYSVQEDPALARDTDNITTDLLIEWTGVI
jgi:hypothetical protein